MISRGGIPWGTGVQNDSGKGIDALDSADNHRIDDIYIDYVFTLRFKGGVTAENLEICCISRFLFCKLS